MRKTGDRFKAEASPPIGNVPDPSNPGRVLICHDTGAGFITLSITPADVATHSTHLTDADGACPAPNNTPVYCPPGSVPDCAGVCNGPSIRDCNGVCYNPTTTPAASLRDCAGVCYNVINGPANVPDCNGVCAGTAVPDCSGTCGGTDVYDCNGVCGGPNFVDCAGNCTACNQPPGAGPKARAAALPKEVEGRSDFYESRKRGQKKVVATQPDRRSVSAQNTYVIPNRAKATRANSRAPKSIAVMNRGGQAVRQPAKTY